MTGQPCFHHPDRESVAYCQKYNRYLCVDCLSCHDPKAHCKFRTACLVHEYERHGIPDEFQKKTGNGS